MISIYEFSNEEKASLFNVLNSVKFNPYKEYVNFKNEVKKLIADSRVPENFLEEIFWHS